MLVYQHIGFLLRSRSPATAWKGIEPKTLSNKFLNASIKFDILKKCLEGSFLWKQRRGKSLKLSRQGNLGESDLKYVIVSSFYDRNEK